MAGPAGSAPARREGCDAEGRNARAYSLETLENVVPTRRKGVLKFALVVDSVEFF